MFRSTMEAFGAFAGPRCAQLSESFKGLTQYGPSAAPSAASDAGFCLRKIAPLAVGNIVDGGEGDPGGL